MVEVRRCRRRGWDTGVLTRCINWWTLVWYQGCARGSNWDIEFRIQLGFPEVGLLVNDHVCLICKAGTFSIRKDLGVAKVLTHRRG